MHPMENVRLKTGGPSPNGNTSVRDASAQAEAGMVLLDLSLQPIAFDTGAAAILHDSQDRNGNPEFALPKEVLETSYTGEPVHIGFNCQYLLDFITATDDAKISLDFKDDQSAGQMRPATEDEYRYRYIVMPMRL